MRLLAVEARQNGSYNLDRYQQVVGLGVELNVLNGEGIAGFWPADRYRLVGSAKIGDIVDAAVRWHAQARFDGVLTFAESAIVSTAIVARALDLPGISLPAALASRNKMLMHQAHDRAGAPHARFRYAATLADGLAAAEQWGYPVVIKPALGASSNFVFRADDPAELADRFELAAKGAQTMKWALLEADGIGLGPQGLVVESFLHGTEHLIEAVAWDGEVVLASVVDRLGAESAAQNQSTFEYNLHWAPTTLTDHQLDLVRDAVTAAVAGHGLRRSVLHVEIRFHDGRPHILEVTPRPGGGGLERMARASAGYDPIWAHVEIACGRRPQVRGFQPTGICTAAHPLICQPGTVTSVTVPPEVRDSADLLFCRLAVEPGDVIKRPPGGNAIVGFIGAVGDSRQSAMDAAIRLAGLIDVTVAN